MLTKKRSELTESTDAYVPLTPSTWRPGEPVVYFLKTFPDFVRGKTAPFPTTTRPAALMPNALPGPIRELYRKEGVAVADRPIVINTTRTPIPPCTSWLRSSAGFRGFGS